MEVLALAPRVALMVPVLAPLQVVVAEPLDSYRTRLEAIDRLMEHLQQNRLLHMQAAGHRDPVGQDQFLFHDLSLDLQLCARLHWENNPLALSVEVSGTVVEVQVASMV